MGFYIDVIEPIIEEIQDGEDDNLTSGYIDDLEFDEHKQSENKGEN